MSSRVEDARVIQLVDEWDKNNGLCLLADHRDDLVARICALLGGAITISSRAAAEEIWQCVSSDVKHLMPLRSQIEAIIDKH